MVQSLVEQSIKGSTDALDSDEAANTVRILERSILAKAFRGELEVEVPSDGSGGSAR